jgi:hypothetical protein
MSYMPPNASNTMPGSRQRMAAGSNATLSSTSGAGAPTVNVTGLGSATVGSLYTDTTAGELYICTATNGTSTIVWTVVGTRS